MIHEIYFYNYFQHVMLSITVFERDMAAAEAAAEAGRRRSTYIGLRLEGKMEGVVKRETLSRCAGPQTLLQEIRKQKCENRIGVLNLTDDSQKTNLNEIFSQYQYVIIERGDHTLGIVDTEIKCDVGGGFPQTAIHLVFECTWDGVMILDRDFRIQMTNSSFQEIFEYHLDKVKGKSIDEIFAGQITRTIKEAGDPGEPYFFCYQKKYIMGKRILLYNDNRQCGTIHVLKDITLQKQRAIELAEAREREESLNSIIQSSYDGIYITDAKGLTLMVNKAHERISGIKAKDIVGKYMRDIVDEGLVSSYITDIVVETKEPVTVRQSVSNGKQLIITGSPIMGEDGNVKKVITNVRDVTELISLEKNLQVSQEMADRYRKKLFDDRDECIVCDSPKFQETILLAGKVAPKDSTVLILGETGVGKEVVAKYIHANSKRKNNHYLTINCGAIPSNLLESELFGYVKGAFTGANQSGKIGLFEMANGGTLFLDEIGELPLNLQASLLRVLQDGEITRIGEAKSRKVDVRIIAATNRDLEKMMRQDIFRSDLYYRLNVFSIIVPPLRERREDIPGLAELTIQKLNKKYSDKKVITSRFIEHLYHREWPGNVREMQNYIEKQFVMTEDEIIDAPNPASAGECAQEQGRAVVVNGIIPIKEAIKEVERVLMNRAMERGRSTYRAAELLGMSQPTFFRKYKELCLDRQCEEEDSNMD